VVVVVSEFPARLLQVRPASKMTVAAFKMEQTQDGSLLFHGLGALTREEVAEAKSNFQAFDVDGDGAICRDDFRAAMLHTGALSWTPPELLYDRLDQMFNSVDVVGSGYVTFRTFAAMRVRKKIQSAAAGDSFAAEPEGSMLQVEDKQTALAENASPQSVLTPMHLEVYDAQPAHRDDAPPFLRPPSGERLPPEDDVPESFKASFAGNIARMRRARGEARASRRFSGTGSDLGLPSPHASFESFSETVIAAPKRRLSTKERDEENDIKQAMGFLDEMDDMTTRIRRLSAVREATP